MLKMPVLETSRLLLRSFTLDDVPALYALSSNPEVVRYVGGKPAGSVGEVRATLERGALRDYAAHGYGRHAVVLKETGVVIGFHGFKLEEEIGETELGYRLMAAHWRKGLAWEAAKVLVEHAWRGLGLARIVSLIHPENAASKGVARKVGMRMERLVRMSFMPEHELELHALERPARPT